MQTIITEKSQTLVRYVGQQTDSKLLSDVLVHKRLRGQIYIRLLSENITRPFAVQNLLLCSFISGCPFNFVFVYISVIKYLHLFCASDAVSKGTNMNTNENIIERLRKYWQFCCYKCRFDVTRNVLSYI